LIWLPTRVEDALADKLVEVDQPVEMKLRVVAEREPERRKGASRAESGQENRQEGDAINEALSLAQRIIGIEQGYCLVRMSTSRPERCPSQVRMIGGTCAPSNPSLL